eukprot:Lankesteria_metandrocarpae@DN4898_c0_g1_i1.p2
MSVKNAYVLLGLNKNASVKELKAAYRKTARDVHPDKNPDDADAQEKFQALKDAYDFLLDPQQRATLDSELEAAELRLKRQRAVDSRRQNFASKLIEKEQAHATATHIHSGVDAETYLKRVRVQNLEFSRRFHSEHKKGERTGPPPVADPYSRTGNSTSHPSRTGDNGSTLHGENFSNTNCTGTGTVRSSGTAKFSTSAPRSDNGNSDNGNKQDFADLEAATMRLLQQMATAQNGGP